MFDYENDERLITSTRSIEDSQENTLRPKTMSDYVGQEKIKKNLEIYIKAAKNRDEALDHVLLYGPPGLGKTTLSHIIASEMGSQIRVTSGPAIERAGDLAAILTNLGENDILFIDEIHRLNRNVEEILYPAMEDYSLDIVIGKGPSARSVRLSLPKFTLIGATTKAGMLTSPLRDRFGVNCRLEMYTPEELLTIIKRSAELLGTQMDERAGYEIARRSRGTPRIANRLLKRVRDFAEVMTEDKKISMDIARKGLAMMEVDDMGLDYMDRKLLSSMIDNFSGGPVGLDTIAATVGEDVNTIEDLCEPYLMQIGFIARTPRGRVCLRKAYEHLGRQVSEEKLREIEELEEIVVDEKK